MEPRLTFSAAPEPRPETPIHPPEPAMRPKTPKFDPSIHNEGVDESMKQLEREMMMQTGPFYHHFLDNTAVLIKTSEESENPPRPQTPVQQNAPIKTAKTPKFDPSIHAAPTGSAPPLEYNPSPRKSSHEKAIAPGDSVRRKTVITTNLLVPIDTNNWP